MTRPLSRLKLLFVSTGRREYAIKAGAFRGLRMELDLANQTQLYLGLFEREVYPFLDKLSSGIKTAIDIGAAEGEYTLYFLLKSPAQKLFSFEPSLKSQSYLKRNLALNGAASHSRLILSSNFVGQENVDNVITLNSLSPQIDLPCLIKVDVDGVEDKILQGAQTLINHGDVRWLIETHSPELEKKCQTFLTSCGYETRIIKNAWWRRIVPEQRPILQNRWLAAWKVL